MIVTVACYKPNSSCSYRGHTQDTYSSGFKLITSNDPEFIATQITELKSQELRDQEVGYELIYLVDGQVIDWEDLEYCEKLDNLDEAEELQIEAEYIINDIRVKVEHNLKNIEEFRKKQKELKDIADAAQKAENERYREINELKRLQSKYPEYSRL